MNADEIEEHCFDVLDDIVSAMDSGETAVVFVGQHQQLNRCMMMNKELYMRFSAAVNFTDFSCEQLALIITLMMHENKREDYMYGYKLHPSCSIETISKIIQKGVPEKLRSELNGHLASSILMTAKDILALRCNMNAMEDIDRSTITPVDLEAAIKKLAKMYSNIL